MSIRLSALLSSVALGLAAAAPGAKAQPTVAEVIVHPPAPPPPDTELKSKTVSFADLNLADESGAETLVGRIHGAAVLVCQPAPTHPGNLRDVADYNKCLNGAMSQAVQDTMNSLVQQVYQRTWGS
jgi:UrcA family protein